MKKIGKRIVGILLCVAMSASMVMPAMASTDVNTPSADEEVITVDVTAAVEEIAEVDETAAAEEIAEVDDIAAIDVTAEDDAVDRGSALIDSENGSILMLAVTAGEGNSDSEEAGIVISQEEVTMYVIGQTLQLSAEYVAQEDAGLRLTWSSSSSKVASVDGTGLVTAVAKGNAVITVSVTSGGKKYTASCAVTVDPYDDGFHQDPEGSDWYYYENGKVSESKTDVIEGNVDGTDGWWNVVDGRVTSGATVAKNKSSGSWWYINADGRADFSYTGFAKNDKGLWYCENGIVDFTVNSVLKDKTGAIGEKGTWWYVVGNEVQTGFTGLANYKNSNGWWYIKNGEVDFNHAGVDKNKNGWWYVTGGKVDFSYSGFASNSNGKWYIENGEVTFKKNSVIKDKTGAIGEKGTWWYVVGSEVQTGFTGLANYKNENGWWYIKNGKVDFSHNGVDKNKNGWWYVTGGEVQFNFTGLANYKNSNGWWYIKNGKVDFTHNGVDKNKNGWWYVSGGKVDFSFNGLASNSNGTWVIKNGEVNFNYNGTYTYSGVKYTVSNGKVSMPSGMSLSMYNKAQSQSSSTNWLIMVDVTNCKLGIFKGSKGNWTPVKCWTCTTGASSTPTILGTFTLYEKGKSFGDGYTCWYWNRFYNGYMIHSVLYQPGSMTEVQDGRLGEHLSHGCVRVELDNAKYIYDNVPIGTTVVTY